MLSNVSGGSVLGCKSHLKQGRNFISGVVCILSWVSATQPSFLHALTCDRLFPPRSPSHRTRADASHRLFPYATAPLQTRNSHVVSHVEASWRRKEAFQKCLDVETVLQLYSELDFIGRGDKLFRISALDKRLQSWQTCLALQGTNILC